MKNELDPNFVVMAQCYAPLNGLPAPTRQTAGVTSLSCESLWTS
jgi:hypothetical protein